jgi:hypothetical protein
MTSLLSEEKSIYRIANEEEYCHQAVAKALFDPIHYLSLFACRPDSVVLRFSPADFFAMTIVDFALV